MTIGSGRSAGQTNRSRSEPTRCAHQTALALRAGWDGRAVPFVRGWVDLALRELAVMALQGQLGPR